MKDEIGKGNIDDAKEMKNKLIVLLFVVSLQVCRGYWVSLFSNDRVRFIIFIWK